MSKLSKVVAFIIFIVALCAMGMFFLTPEQTQEESHTLEGEAGLTHQCLYFEQPHTFEQILFIQTAEPALVGHA